MQLTLCFMTNRMDQIEIQADEELGITKQSWDDEKTCLKGEVSKRQVEIERPSRFSYQVLLVVVVFEVFDGE